MFFVVLIFNDFLMIFFFLAHPPASLMELPAQEGPGTSRDSAPVSYQLKVSAAAYLICANTFLGTL